jgi:serine/threonine protein kinase
MPNARAAPAPSSGAQSELLNVLERFDRAWRGRTPPQIDEFLPPRSGFDGAEKEEETSRRAQLEELIKIDLEYRWRRASPDRAEFPTGGSDERSPDPDLLPLRPLLEDYLAQYHELGLSEVFSPELIAEEYRVRRRWGDRPGHEEYAARFALQCEDLDTTLAAIDAELASEFGPAWSPDPAVGPTELRRKAEGGHTPAPLPAATAPKAGAEPTQRIGKYMVIEMLDEGGQALVFRVLHPELHKDFVLKLAKRPIQVGTESNADTPVRDRLIGEARLLAQCDHPNLVRVVDLDIHEGRPFVVMDHVHGRNLEDYARDEPVAPRRSARLVAELARAVFYLHARGIVHQDIKPRNVLIDAQGRPLLIDFGLARLRHAWSVETTRWTGGTAAYMSPEQALGRADRIGPRTDVFGLGGLLYHLLTGRPLYQGISRISMLGQAIKAEYIPVRQIDRRVPRALERICHKALSADPERRYRTAGELERALRWFLVRRRVAGAGLAAITVMTVAWNVPRPQPRLSGPEREANSPLTAATRVEPASVLAPLKIDAFIVDHFRFRGNDRQELAAIGDSTEPFVEDDRVRVSAQLSAPAYAYLIALNPDGKDQLCRLPSDVKKPPSLLREIQLGESTYFRLTDGSGLQAFVVVASRKELPPYEKWEGRGVLRQCWRHVATDNIHGIWEFKDGKVNLISRASRGPLEKRPDVGPAPFQDVCDELKKLPDVEAIRAIAFPIRPKQ